MCPRDTSEDDKAKKILSALDDTISRGPWEESKFLKAIRKELEDIRAELVEYIGRLEGEKNIGTARAGNRFSQTVNKQEIFISLYSAEGRHIQQWERIVTNLPQQIISRPIYAHEEDVISWIKQKENKVNEAYISVLINPDDILVLPEDKIPRDKSGKPLLVLKSRAINLDSIQKFVHLSEEYRYFQGRLVKGRQN